MKADKIFPLLPPLPLPDGVTEAALYKFARSVRVADAPAKEMEAYCREDFRRFVYTYGLVRDLNGRGLELGANPYFTTMLIKKFTDVDLSLANYFGPQFGDELTQAVEYRALGTNEIATEQLMSYHFNIEEQRFPFEDGTFDVVLFCEIIEHLLMDPVKVLREIRRVLTPGGRLILTTPNVSRLENVARMISGGNIYDPYSGYGPYGRHNREYNRHELGLLLPYLGFEIEDMFTADVHENRAEKFLPLGRFANLVKYRQEDLGQYIFCRARIVGKDRGKRPAFLYRSYPENELDHGV